MVIFPILINIDNRKYCSKSLQPFLNDCRHEVSMKYFIILSVLLNFGFLNAQTPSEEILEITHTCAVTTKKAHCWGDNDYGQAGVNKNFVNPRSLVSSFGHNCLIDDEGVWCWGNNENGQIQVPFGLKNTKQVAVGFRHTCALDDDGVKCWGNDQSSQTRVPADLQNPRKLFLGGDVSCVIESRGLVCWGDNSSEQLLVPDRLLSVRDVFFDSGADTVCALDDYGVMCWGESKGTFNNSKNWQKMVFVGNGASEYCFLLQAKIICRNYEGQNLETPNISSITKITSNGYLICALHNAGVSCWTYTGQNRSELVIKNPPNVTLNKLSQLSIADDYSCGFDDIKGFYCWGSYVGVKNYPQMKKPELIYTGRYNDMCVVVEEKLDCFRVTSNEKIDLKLGAVRPTRISGGNGGYCLVYDKKLKCVATSGFDAGNVISTYPQNLNNVIDVEIRDVRACALTANQIICWGDGVNRKGVIFETANNNRQLVVGDSFECVLDTGIVKCWGDANANAIEVPSGLMSVTKIVSGSSHICAMTNNQVVCWGGNDINQSNVPVGLGLVKDIFAGHYSSCARTDAGVRCWGNNRHSQLTIPEAL